MAGRSTAGDSVYELSGVVVGSGDEVYALTPFDRDGVAAEYAVVPADVLAPKPLRLSHVEAAALPMGGLTAWQALFVHGRLARGERVLVTGASGGLGTSPSSLRDMPAQRSWRRSGRSGLRHAWRRGPRRRARGHDRRGDAGRDLLHRRTRPRATAGVENARGRRRASRGGRLGFPLTEARAAFERVAGRGKRGKVVLEVGTD